MAIFLYEIEGLNTIVKILESIINDEDKDSPNVKRSKELLHHCNEILENYVGIENEFSCPNIKQVYNELILDLLDSLIDKAFILKLGKLQINFIQFCEQNDDTIILHVGEQNESN